YRAGRDSGTFSYATHAARVEVDAETGLVELLDYVVVEDGGTLINPMIVDGQIRGGTAQGIGTCLFEAMPFSAQGQPLASTMLDYLLPGACDVPNIRVLHMQTPSPHTEFGMKGIAEGGAVGPPAAIVCAVNDALHCVGAEVHDLPLTPARILAAIETAVAQQKRRGSTRRCEPPTKSRSFRCRSTVCARTSRPWKRRACSNGWTARSIATGRSPPSPA